MGTHLHPADDAEYQIASDLGRKVASDVSDVILRAMQISGSAYAAEVIALAAAASVLTMAAATVRNGSAKDATPLDVAEALLGALSPALKANAAAFQATPIKEETHE